MKPRDEAIAYAFRNVDTQDIAWLVSTVGDGGHGQFWKSVMREIDSALRRGDGEQVRVPKLDTQEG